MLLRTLFLLAFVTGFNIAAQAQKPERIRPAQPANDASRVDASASRPDSKINVGSPEEEMIARADLKAAEKDYKENLERAREAAQLSSEILEAYQHNKSLSRIEEKKLERLEKLTRKIRSEAGGSDGEVTLEDVPAQMEPALARLTELSDSMRKGVENTPRQVVSAAVIERANELLEIIRYVRNFTRSAKS
jgi:ribosome-binding protein aMBF1 (putative translation factor)